MGAACVNLSGDLQDLDKVTYHIAAITCHSYRIACEVRSKRVSEEHFTKNVLSAYVLIFVPRFMLETPDFFFEASSRTFS